MSEIKRYYPMLRTSYDRGEPRSRVEMEELDRGLFVLYADVAPLLAEHDTTPVDAEWLDRVMGPRKRDVMGRDYWEKGGFALHDWHDRSGLRIIVGHSVDIQNPTRGDVLTALRLFKGNR